MVSRSGRLNAGGVAALGISLALHVGLAALLVVQRPQPPDVEQDFAVSVSLAAPVVETSSAVAGSSVASAAPIEIATSRPAAAALLRPEQAVSTLVPAAAATALKATEATAETAASSPSFGSAPRGAAPSTSITETPRSVPAVSALKAPLLTSDEPMAPLVGTALAPPIAVEMPTAVLLAPPPPDPGPDVARRGGTTLLSNATALASGGAQATEPPAVLASIGTPAATVVGFAADTVAVTDPRAPPLRFREGALDPSVLPKQAASVTPLGSQTEATGVVTAVIPPGEEIVQAAGQRDPRPVIPPSLSSGPHGSAQAANLPDSDLVAHEETEAERSQMIQAFIDRYDGGACFFMAPARHVTSELEIHGFATDRDKIHRFDEGFKAVTGSEAKVVGQWISQKQCATVDFLQAARHGSQGPTIEIDRRDLRKGDVLSGTIGGVGPEPIRLYWISEAGLVDDVSERVQDQGERKTFAVPVRRFIDGGPYPQLLVAIIADGSWNAAGKTTKADDFFAAIEADALRAHRPVAASGQPFRLLP